MKSTLHRKNFTWLIACVIPLIALLVPIEWYQLSGLTVIQQRVIALFLFAALFWILEPIPIYATSVLLITLELLLLSDSSLIFLRQSGTQRYGNALSFQEIIATFASPVIMLFLGGFFLAVAATKYRLDQSIAGTFLSYFGEKPKWVLLGLMSITAFFSMFMSNTATTAMMLSILIPVLAAFPADDKARRGFVLGIPIAANLGGIGTPIGTPPNAIALRFIGTSSLSFGEWMMFGLPFVIIMVLIGWAILLIVFPATKKEIKLQLPVSFSRSPKAILVYVTFIITILMWLLDFLHGVNAYIVALIPVSVFLSTGVLNKEDLKLISWDVLWLVSGGIAIGLALDKSGLAALLMSTLAVDALHPMIILTVFCLIGLVMANFMSNTATANLVLPLLASLQVPLANSIFAFSQPYIILGTTICISLGMSLPISTPPNALAYATGQIITKDMTRMGIIIGLIGIVLALLLVLVLNAMNFFS